MTGKPEALTIEGKPYFYCPACQEYYSMAKLGVTKNADVGITIDVRQDGYMTTYWTEDDVDFLDNCDFTCGVCYEELSPGEELQALIDTIDWDLNPPERL